MKPTAAPPYFPYPHPTLAEVACAERAERRAAELRSCGSLSPSTTTINRTR